MFKCTVCGYIHDGDSAPEKCPKCGAPKEKFEKLTDEASALVEKSRLTNDLHMQLASLMDNIYLIAEEGREQDLDPGCNIVFERAMKYSQEIKQMVKAEIQVHISKGKWG